MLFVNLKQIWEIFAEKTKNGKQIEVCGYLASRTNIERMLPKCNSEQPFNFNSNDHRELVPIICGVETSEDRASCSHYPTIYNSYDSIIWHTHPNNSKSYPSVEDIIKMLKPRPNPNPMDSLIICRWGIWEFNAKNKQSVDMPEMIRLLEHYLNQIGKEAFNEWKRITGKTDENEYRNNRVDLTTGILNTINTNISKLNTKLHMFQFNINFTSWETLEESPYYILKNLNENELDFY